MQADARERETQPAGHEPSELRAPVGPQRLLEAGKDQRQPRRGADDVLVVQVRLHEAAEREGEPGNHARRPRQLPGARERVRPQRGDGQVQQSQRDEADLRWQRQQRQQDGRRGETDLTVGEQRIAAHDLGRPQRKAAFAQLLRGPRVQRVVEDRRVALNRDQPADESVGR